ncbi:MAG: TetR/AcrR family transcriptional regulator C-terminal domain-containing protein [Pseudomonadota bacterium]
MKRHRRAPSEQPPPAVGGRPALVTKEQIVDAALALGVDNLSMHGLARHLGVSTAALYRYVGSREGLLDACMDVFCERVELPSQDLPWRDYLIGLSVSFRNALLKTPGASVYGIKVGPTTPAAYRIIEKSLAVLRQAGFSPLGAFRAYGLVLDHVFTCVQKEEQYARLEQENGRYGYQMLQLDDATLARFPYMAESIQAMLPPDLESGYQMQVAAIVRGLEID